jgi:hypothetical protein
MAAIAIEQPNFSVEEVISESHDSEFKEPYNVWYFLGFIASLAIPTLPAILTWIKVFNGYSF